MLGGELAKHGPLLERQVIEASGDEFREPVGGLERVLVERPEILEAGGPVPDGLEAAPDAVASLTAQERGDLAGQVAWASSLITRIDRNRTSFSSQTAATAEDSMSTRSAW